MPLIPAHLVEQLHRGAVRRAHQAGHEGAGRPMMIGEPGQRAGHRHRQDRDLAAVGVRDRLLPLPVPAILLLGDLRHADAAGEVRIGPTYKVVSDFGMLNS
jgi:hypothetical protein